MSGGGHRPGSAGADPADGREVAWEGRRGDLLVVPGVRHALQAFEDSAVLLTVSKTAQAVHP
jgi:hypothetical protein